MAGTLPFEGAVRRVWFWQPNLSLTSPPAPKQHAFKKADETHKRTCKVWQCGVPKYLYTKVHNYYFRFGQRHRESSCPKLLFRNLALVSSPYGSNIALSILVSFNRTKAENLAIL